MTTIDQISKLLSLRSHKALCDVMLLIYLRQPHILGREIPFYYYLQFFSNWLLPMLSFLLHEVTPTLIIQNIFLLNLRYALPPTFGIQQLSLLRKESQPHRRWQEVTRLQKRLLKKQISLSQVPEKDNKTQWIRARKFIAHSTANIRRNSMALLTPINLSLMG